MTIARCLIFWIRYRLQTQNNSFLLSSLLLLFQPFHHVIYILTQIPVYILLQLLSINFLILYRLFTCLLPVHKKQFTILSLTYHIHSYTYNSIFIHYPSTYKAQTWNMSITDRIEHHHPENGNKNNFVSSSILIIILVMTINMNILTVSAFQSTIPPGQHARTTVRMRFDSNMKIKDGNGVGTGDSGVESMGRRRSMIVTLGAGGGGIFDGIFGKNPTAAAVPKGPKSSSGPTNEVIKVVNGMKQRRLGGTDIMVSELGLGTQRW